MPRSNSNPVPDRNGINKAYVVAATVVAALLGSLGAIVGQYSPSKEAFAEVKTEIALLQQNQFTSEDRQRLWEVQSDVRAIKDKMKIRTQENETACSLKEEKEAQCQIHIGGE